VEQEPSLVVLCYVAKQAAARPMPVVTATTGHSAGSAML